MTTDRLLAHKLNQWRLYNPYAMIRWIRKNTEVRVGPDGPVIVWKEES